jgi:hypothetical protein
MFVDLLSQLARTWTLARPQRLCKAPIHWQTL